MYQLENYKLIELDSIDSTNLEAIRLIQNDKISSEVTVILAKSQSAGKGRLDRKWVSKEGNLFTSIIINKADEYNPILTGNLLPYISALAIGDTLKEFIKNGQILYKWPNDVLVNEKKISGVLIEIIDNYIVIGIGINLVDFPDSGTKFPATCLKAHADRVVKVKEVLELLVKNLLNRLKLNEQEVITNWMQSIYGFGKRVSVNQGEIKKIGILKGLNSNGELILQTDEGKSEAITYGDIIFEKL